MIFFVSYWIERKLDPFSVYMSLWHPKGIIHLQSNLCFEYTPRACLTNVNNASCIPLQCISFLMGCVSKRTMKTHVNVVQA